MPCLLWPLLCIGASSFVQVRVLEWVGRVNPSCWVCCTFLKVSAPDLHGENGRLTPRSTTIWREVVGEYQSALVSLLVSFRVGRERGNLQFVSNSVKNATHARLTTFVRDAPLLSVHCVSLLFLAALFCLFGDQIKLSRSSIGVAI